MGFPSFQKTRTRQLSSQSASSSSSTDGSSDAFILQSKKYSDSPPSSPTLPLYSLHDTRPRRSRLGVLFHASIWAFVVGFLLWATSSLFFKNQELKVDIAWLKKEGDNATFIHEDVLPERPLPVVMKDNEGRTRWTVSIPAEREFPLEPVEYLNLCININNLAHHLAYEQTGYIGHYGYYHVDNNFMDVNEAEQSKLFPPSMRAHHTSVVAGVQDDKYNGQDNVDKETGMCKRTLTYVLKSSDAGFGGTLMGLWLSYGLAAKENRAFFIDDRDWAYGKYSTYFTPPPKPSCLPPPESHRLSCPHQANHLLVSSGTTHWTYGHAFDEEFEDPRGMEVMRQVNIFALMRHGYEALFQLADADATYVTKRVQQIDDAIRPGLKFGIHVRHGDKHPYEQQWSRTYEPLRKYSDAANVEMFKELNGTEDSARISVSRMVLASDDPAVYDNWGNNEAVRAQERAIVDSQEHDNGTVTADGAKLRLDWEGGFFADRFWNLTEQHRGFWAQDPTLVSKALLARAYLLDLAVVSKSDRVICTVSSIGCRLLAVMMGWDQAILQKKWINIDGEFDWEGIRW